MVCITNRNRSYGYLLAGLLLLLSVAACAKAEKSITEQTGDMEKIIDQASKGEAIAEQDFASVSFAEDAKQKILEKICLEPDSSQIFTIIGLPDDKPEGQRISLIRVLEADAETRQELYQTFLENQKADFGTVKPLTKRFSKSYEQDGMAYVFVEVPFQFDKLVMAGKEYPVRGCTLYRAYLWQKTDNKWKLSSCRERAFLSEEDRMLMFPENSETEEKDLEKFLTVFGKRVEFE